jgi:hypothetical protein
MLEADDALSERQTAGLAEFYFELGVLLQADGRISCAVSPYFCFSKSGSVHDLSKNASVGP